MTKRYLVVRKVPAPKTPQDHANRKRWIIVYLLGYAALYGAISCFLSEENSPVDTLLAVPFLLLALAWCFADARERGHPIGRATWLLLVFLFIVGLPVYFIQSRGARGLKTLALSALLMTSIGVCIYFSNWAMAYVGAWFGLWEILPVVGLAEFNPLS